MRRVKLIAPPVAIIVFDGMQSHRWAAPPTMSRSIIVTSAPRRAAYVAAVLPAGPPPMITKRSGHAPRLPATAVSRRPSGAAIAFDSLAVDHAVVANIVSRWSSRRAGQGLD